MKKINLISFVVLGSFSGHDLPILCHFFAQSPVLFATRERNEDIYATTPYTSSASTTGRQNGLAQSSVKAYQ